jgi:peptide/nickel transport system ATP-binding protein
VTDAARDAPILEVRSLSKVFSVPGGGIGRGAGVRAVDDVTFALYPGRITALVGESGSGKSTVARLLARLYRPTSGTILYRGNDIGRQARFLGARQADLRYRAEVQMIFQDPFASLNPVKRIEHAVARPLEIHNVVPGNQVRRTVYELLAGVGLNPPAEIARKYHHQLSGGQRQRVAIARALAVKPAVLLADEPISMLDVSIRIGVLNLMSDLKSERNIAFLYITHDISSARYIADETLVMYRGQIVEQGPTEAVMQTPLHPYTRLLLSAVPDPERQLAFEQSPVKVHAVTHPEYDGHVEGAAETALVEMAPGHRVRCRIAGRKSA